MTTTTLTELAEAATDGDKDGAIQFVLDRLADRPADRREFLRGLTDRILVTGTRSTGADVVAQWLGSWIVSCVLEVDARFLAADSEASKLADANKIGNGISSADLRARYGR